MRLLGVPSSAGAFAPGQELAPAALREAGLVERLRAGGVAVEDLGDSPVWRWRPDRRRPRAQNLEAVAATVRETAERVERALAGGDAALVLGGDCTIELGTVAGALAHGPSVGLVYFDLHPDLNVPDSVAEGALDWMGMAHALGVDGAEDELVSAGPRMPLLADDQVLFLSYGPEQARPFEREQMERRGLAGIPVHEVAGDPEAAARHALEWAEPHFERLLVHFDVDVIDFTDAPLSENTGRNEGISLDTALGALAVLSSSDRLAAVTVTELNPLHGEEDGSTLERFVEGLAGCLT
jgi:arginase